MSIWGVRGKGKESLNEDCILEETLEGYVLARKVYV